MIFPHNIGTNMGAGIARDPLNKLAILILSIWASDNKSHIRDA